MGIAGASSQENFNSNSELEALRGKNSGGLPQP